VVSMQQRQQQRNSSTISRSALVELKDCTEHVSGWAVAAAGL
jgi:hypothetical protein